MRVNTRLCSIVVAVLTVILGGGMAWGATTFYVNVATGLDTNDCLAPVPGAPPVGPCKTINHAISLAAAAGDTINVAAGTYPEDVAVTKSLTLNGAQAGVDARNPRVGPESIISNACGPIQIFVADVTVDGFQVQDGSGTACPLGFNSGIWTAAGTDGGQQILNNIITKNAIGLVPASTGVKAVLVKQNLFNDNNAGGAASGSGIYTDFGLANASIESNKFVKNLDVSMNIIFASGGITIKNNQTDGASIALFGKPFPDPGTVGVSITDNTTSGNGTASAIYLGGNTHTVTITGNALAGGSNGIKVEDAFGLGANSGVVANLNCIIANSTSGLTVVAGGTSGVVNAENNWWGAASGPGPIGPGTGDKIVSAPADVDFSPFLTAPAAACALAFPFKDILRGTDINPGSDVCGTGHAALNFTGGAGPAGSTWLTVLDGPPPPTFGVPVKVQADVCIHTYNNTKGPALVALFHETPATAKGFALFLFDAGASDRLTLATVSPAGALTAVANLGLGAGILENVWYRLTMDVALNPVLPNVKVTGTVFKHLIPSDPNSGIDGQVGGTLTFTGVLPAGVVSPGEVGIAASAASTNVDSSVTNFVVGP